MKTKKREKSERVLLLEKEALKTRKLGYSFREATVASSLSRRSLEYLIKKGQLEAFKIGNRVVIKARSLEELLGAK